MGYEQSRVFDVIKRSVDEQLARTQYPEGFPALPPLPAARYYDPAFAQIEQSSLWKKTWLLVGLESELPEPGSYVLFEQLGQSVIISRDKTGAIKAHHNICRHRSSALLTEPKGRVTRFSCPYHAWNYALDGRLIGVPDSHDFACLDKSERGLLPVRCEIWRGVIFINFDSNAVALAEFMRPVGIETMGFPIEKCVVKDHFFIDMGCNWKLAYHNFLELYHVELLHRNSLSPHLESKSFIVSMLEHGHSRTAVRKRKGSSIFMNSFDKPSTVDDGFSQYTVVMPTFPNVSFALDPSGFAFQSFWPNGVDRSVMELRLVGIEGESSDDPAYWAALRESMQVIVSEDIRLFPTMQTNISSGWSPDILMNYQERALYWFEEELDRTIGVEKIPEAMRVKQVLGDQVASQTEAA